jgi:hypothetical protein
VAIVSARYLQLAALPKRDLASVFEHGAAPDVTALTGFEYRGFNQPRAAALLGIRKFIKAFYLDSSQQPYGCNTPVTQNGLDAEWLAKPNPENPKRYAFFKMDSADPESAHPLARKAVSLDYSKGRNPPHEAARILRDYLVRIEPGSDDLLLGRAFFVLAGHPVADSYFLIERYRPLTDTAELARH